MPTVGMSVWYYTAEFDPSYGPVRPLAATVTEVLGPTLVNVAVFKSDGSGMFGRSRISFVSCCATSGQCQPPGE